MPTVGSLAISHSLVRILMNVRTADSRRRTLSGDNPPGVGPGSKSSHVTGFHPRPVVKSRAIAECNQRGQVERVG